MPCQSRTAVAGGHHVWFGALASGEAAEPATCRRVQLGKERRPTEDVRMADVEKRYQVFVSSTYRDLVEERREVIQALLELDCIPAGMELFPAANEDQWSLIRGVIDDCDYYLVIIGGRYGSVDEEGISFTEREYDYALSLQKPILGFVHGSPEEIRAGNLDSDPVLRVRLESFRAKVMGKPVRFFTNPHELGSVVSRSLIRLTKDAPAEGWVRARFAQSPETIEELSQLRAQLAQFELDKAIASRTTVEIEDLAQGHDWVEIQFSLSPSWSHSQPVSSGSANYTWNQLVALLGPMMIEEAAEASLIRRLEDDVLLNLRGSGQLQPSVSMRVQVDPRSFDKIKIQLRALRLIQKGSRRRPVSDKDVYWVLTELGDQLVVDISAIRRDGNDDKGNRARLAIAPSDTSLEPATIEVP